MIHPLYARQTQSVEVFLPSSPDLHHALRILLPKELAFLISDQGTHFRSKAMAQLTQDLDFIQIPIYRHRPQTNGIADALCVP
jgi:hypothetical protein